MNERYSDAVLHESNWSPDRGDCRLGPAVNKSASAQISISTLVPLANNRWAGCKHHVACRLLRGGPVIGTSSGVGLAVIPASHGARDGRQLPDGARPPSSISWLVGVGQVDVWRSGRVAFAQLLDSASEILTGLHLLRLIGQYMPELCNGFL